MQKLLRHIDTVTVKGSIEPLELYTVDVSLENLLKKLDQKDTFDVQHLPKEMKRKKRVIDRIKRNKLRKEILEGKKNILDLF